MHIALVGTRGVPARYGGFETCVEEVGQRLAAANHRVTVYCRPNSDVDRLDSYKGMQLVRLPALHRRSLETLSHTGLSVGHLVGHRADAAIVFNAANSPYLPLLRMARIPVATHVDGLEWKRAKWGAGGRRFYRYAESMSVRWSDALIADAKGIQDYYDREVGVETELISYGAPHVTHALDRLPELGLEPEGYHLVVARFEPENHVDLIVEGYVRSKALLPLVVVGSAPYADRYTQSVHASGDSRVRFLGGVWDQDLLDQLYANALSYVHGHSVGGTNPSLLRAIGSGTATTAFDVSFNRDVLQESGLYFKSSADVARAVEETESERAATSNRAALAAQRATDYDWDDVAASYERLCVRLAARDFVRRSGGLALRRSSHR